MFTTLFFVGNINIIKYTPLNSGYMKLSIIIPVYNEKATIDKIVHSILQTRLPYQFSKEIIIIDDGSTDGTRDVVQNYAQLQEVKLLFQKNNQGKTAAVKKGIENATGDYILIQDADLEYPATNYALLLEKAFEQNASVVYGSRFLGTIENMTWINKMANIISNKTMNCLFRTRMTDFHTCHKLLKKEIFERITIRSQNFSFDTEITAKILRHHIPIIEIPIDYVARDKKDGKKITWATALEAYWTLFKCRLFPLD
jgi:glycosyltransferase involved in cell wall biosynthesis